MPDTPRPVATTADSPYTLSIEDAAELYAKAGHPRTLRTVQRYCASGHLDCVKAATLMGDKYFVEPSSVARHVAQIDELIALDTRASGHGAPRQDATAQTQKPMRDDARQAMADRSPMSAPVAAQTFADAVQPPTSAEDGQPRPDATKPLTLSRPDATPAAELPRQVAQLEREVERLSEDRSFLRQQIATKDEQIAALLERDRETNILVRGLQQMLSPLLGGPRSSEPPSDTRFE